MLEKLRVGVDACPLVSHRTGVGNYIHDILLPACEANPAVTWVLYSNTDIHFPDRPNVVQRSNAGNARGVFWQNFHLPKLLKRDGITVYWGANGFIPLRDLGKTRAVVTIHDLVHRFQPATSEKLVRWSRRVCQPSSAKKADVVTCNSDATAADVATVYGVESWATMRPMIGGAFAPPSASKVAEMAAKYSLPEHYILVVGTLEPRKNIPLFLDAVAHCRAAGIDLPMVVHAGGSGWLAAETEASITAAEAAGWLRRLGFVPTVDLPALYNACTVFCMPSSYEGYGMPIAEALNCGAAVMHGNHLSMVEASGGFGYAFAPTIPGMANALKLFALGKMPLRRREQPILPQTEPSSDVLFAAIMEAALSECRPVQPRRSPAPQPTR